MNAQEKGWNEPKTGSMGARRRAMALISAGACIGVAAIVVALSFLF